MTLDDDTLTVLNTKHSIVTLIPIPVFYLLKVIDMGHIYIYVYIYVRAHVRNILQLRCDKLD